MNNSGCYIVEQHVLKGHCKSLVKRKIICSTRQPNDNTQNTFCVHSFLEEVSPLSLFLFSYILLLSTSLTFHMPLPLYLPSLPPPSVKLTLGIMVFWSQRGTMCVRVCVCKGLCESPPNPVPLRLLTAQQINTAFPPLLPPYTFSCPKVSTTSQHTKTKKERHSCSNHCIVLIK